MTRKSTIPSESSDSKLDKSLKYASRFTVSHWQLNRGLAGARGSSDGNKDFR